MKWEIDPLLPMNSPCPTCSPPQHSPELPTTCLPTSYLLWHIWASRWCCRGPLFTGASSSTAHNSSTPCPQYNWSKDVLHKIVAQILLNALAHLNTERSATLFPTALLFFIFIHSVSSPRTVLSSDNAMYVNQSIVSDLDDNVCNFHRKRCCPGLKLPQVYL